MEIVINPNEIRMSFASTKESDEFVQNEEKRKAFMDAASKVQYNWIENIKKANAEHVINQNVNQKALMDAEYNRHKPDRIITRINAIGSLLIAGTAVVLEYNILKGSKKK